MHWLLFLVLVPCQLWAVITIECTLPAGLSFHPVNPMTLSVLTMSDQLQYISYGEARSEQVRTYVFPDAAGGEVLVFLDGVADDAWYERMTLKPGSTTHIQLPDAVCWGKADFPTDWQKIPVSADCSLRVFRFADGTLDPFFLAGRPLSRKDIEAGTCVFVLPFVRPGKYRMVIGTNTSEVVFGTTDFTVTEKEMVRLSAKKDPTLTITFPDRPTLRHRIAIAPVPFEQVVKKTIYLTRTGEPIEE